MGSFPHSDKELVKDRRTRMRSLVGGYRSIYPVRPPGRSQVRSFTIVSSEPLTHR